jgi:Fic family protein
VLNRLLDGFEGKLTTSKYSKLTKCSQDTAYRDILPLVERGILVRSPAGGRSTSYALAANPKQA